MDGVLEVRVRLRKIMEVASLFFLARRRWKKQGHAPLSSGGRPGTEGCTRASAPA